MKKILKTMFVLMCGCVMATALVSCGSDGDDGGNNKQFTINGEWMSDYNGGRFEFYTLNGNSVNCVIYTVSFSSFLSQVIINGTTLNTKDITNIQKVENNGSFTYDKLQLICTFPEVKIEGFVTVHDYEEFVWSRGLSNITMIRANSKTNALKAQLEQEYQAKYAK